MPFQPSELTDATLRRFVDNLARYFRAHPPTGIPKRSQLQEAIAITLGWPSYHAAVSELKRRASTKPDKSSLASQGKDQYWFLPESFTHATLLPEQWRASSDQAPDTEQPLPVAQGNFASSVLLLGSERNRRTLISDLMTHNPNRPVCWVKGPMSILGDIEGADTIKMRPMQSMMSHASASDIAGMIIGLLPQEGDSQMWQNRAISLLSSVLFALVYLRDNNKKSLPLTLQSIQNALVLGDF